MSSCIADVLAQDFGGAINVLFADSVDQFLMFTHESLLPPHGNGNARAYRTHDFPVLLPHAKGDTVVMSFVHGFMKGIIKFGVPRFVFKIQLRHLILKLLQSSDIFRADGLYE